MFSVPYIVFFLLEMSEILLYLHDVVALYVLQYISGECTTFDGHNYNSKIVHFIWKTLATHLRLIYLVIYGGTTNTYSGGA